MSFNRLGGIIPAAIQKLKMTVYNSILAVHRMAFACVDENCFVFNFYIFSVQMLHSHMHDYTTAVPCICSKQISTGYAARLREMVNGRGNFIESMDVFVYSKRDD